MSIGKVYASDFYSRAPQYRTKKMLAMDFDKALEDYHKALLELATEVRKFDLICIEDKYKMPAAWSVPAIKAKVILQKFEEGKL
jgi:hypothetical protein